MISKENKLFEEIDKPLASKTISKDEKKGIIERQSSWTGQIKGIRLFPSGTTEGKGNSKIFANGITISDWQGIFSTEKNTKYRLLERTYPKMASFT